MEVCPLCNHPSRPFYKEIFFICSHCDAIFRGKNFLPSAEEEKTRYETHNNDVNDPGYQKFVSPITDAVLRNFSTHNIGLDFGAGTGPVISKILGDKGYHIKQYDPFFIDRPDVLQEQYDYIVCCEVMEHFHSPAKEFKLLKKLLKDDGHLYCMTHLYEPLIDFANWYYKNDDTHVFIYQQKTLEYIKYTFAFNDVSIEGRLIVFS